MIKGIQAMFYSSEAEKLSEFLQEKLGFKMAENINGCLVLGASEVQLVSHPIDEATKIKSGLNHISFYCENIEQTVANLKGKGVEFKGDIEDHGYGYVTYFKAPGDFYIQLYEPKSAM